MVPETLLELFDEQVRRAAVDDDGLQVGEGWSAVLWAPADVDRALARLRELPGHAEWKTYGHDPPAIRERLLAEGFEPDDEEAVLVAEATSIAAAPADVELRVELERTVAWVTAIVDGLDASRGRVELPPGSEFAGLFGGETQAEFRGRGLYRATVAARAQIARERGYRWLYVDALPTSRPILERLGFVQITTTTPFTPAA